MGLEGESICNVRVANPISMPPFLKWAGGKRWLIPHLLPLVGDNPGTYFEPFLGSGAVFFGLTPKNAVLSDLNNELVKTYRVVRDDWSSLLEYLYKHQKLHSKSYYYLMRNKVPKTGVERAARFIYLNRTCWNGLYRVSQDGRFNVPIGTKTSVILPTDDFESVAGLLRSAKILRSDFERVVGKAKRGDFIFADPPYTVAHALNGFIKYNEKLFSWEDQERLAACLGDAAKRGVSVVATNANHKSIRALYRNGFRVRLLTRYSRISGDVAGRRECSEVLITATLRHDGIDVGG